MKPKVLLVEDDPTTCAFLHAVTLALDVEVDLAATVRQALDLVAQTYYVAWLLDARLPDGSGEDLLARLRQICPGVPALVHTASSDLSQLQRLQDAGFNAVVAKPLSVTEWHKAVRALLATAMMAVPALWDDAAGLRMLGGDASALGALRELFVQELPQQIDALEHARAQGNEAAIDAELHRLTASCSVVGAARLAQAIRVWRGNSAALADVLHVAGETLTAVSAWPDEGHLYPAANGRNCATSSHDFNPRGPR